MINSTILKPRIVERVNDFVVLIQNFPYHSREVWDKKKGIVRVWGRDGNNKKLNYVIYPKKYYTKDYIEKTILPQYDVCPKCQIGEEIGLSPKKTEEIRNYLKEQIKDKKNYNNVLLTLPFLLIPIGIGLGIYHYYKND